MSTRKYLSRYKYKKKKGVGKPIKPKKGFIDKLSGLTILLIKMNIQKGNVSKTWI